MAQQQQLAVPDASITLSNKPASLQYKNYRFVIMDSPTNENVSAYIEKKNVTQVVRACDPSYDKKSLENVGMHVTELPFSDGEPPPDEVIDNWLNIVDKQFSKGKQAQSKEEYVGVGPTNGSSNDAALAVHCVAGLGRAPVLVAIALLETGMSTVDAIDLIRKRRRGAINARQLKFLESYKPRSKAGGCCVIL
jgi:protein tyrosine phosphatase type 4A